MMIRSLACILFVVCFFSKVHGQSCPPNLDFETGNFTNWECFIGRTDTLNGQNRMLLTPSPPQFTRHEIITSSAVPDLDPYGQFPKLCPYGGNYSVKLGNDFTGAQAEALSYTFQVPSTTDTFSFTYFYAVVFEDPRHSLPEQPRFFVTAYDVGTGKLINCASYDYVSTAALPGFQRSPTNPSVLYKNWTPTSLQFAGLGGHTVRLEFRTADCTPGGHFGYAYIDIASACSNILATAPYCIETNSLILDAPFGFQSYTWYNSSFSSVIGTGQSFTLSPPPVTSGVFYVDVVPYPGFGCRDTLQAVVTPLPVPDTPVAPPVVILCQFQTPVSLTAKVAPGHQLLWYASATGGVPSTVAPRPPTSTPGISKYYVSQKALFGCEGFRREITVKVISTPVASFTINQVRQCQNGNSYVFTSNSTNLNEPSYAWEFGDGQSFSSTDTFAKYSYATSKNFIVKMKATNANTCTAERTQIVTVVPLPIAAFAFPALICENQTMVTLTDQSSVPAGIASINNWWWSVGGKTMQGPAPPPATAPGGPLAVKLVVTTMEGCRSDTTTKVIAIRYAPLPAFGIGDLMCNNETIRFTDQSTLPAGAGGETIAKWYWTFDNAGGTTAQNPTSYFSAGTHNAQLITESRAGCKSRPTERSFEIYPKPQIQLDINDSCVLVPITYAARDVTGNAIKWDWNFGNGFRAGPTSQTATYNREGSRPFAIVAQTARGCKDSLFRPFTIFDNKSFAGRDTVAAKGEPVQLNARGELNMRYSWSPAVGLSQVDIEKPLATLDRDQIYQLYTITDKGCKARSEISIKRFAGPELYMPTAFTPNNDGVNDRFFVTPIGIKSFGYMAVYNRWGQLLFRTTNYNEGWDGKLGGMPVGTNTFVVVAQAIDYKGKVLFRKGTVTLVK